MRKHAPPTSKRMHGRVNRLSHSDINGPCMTNAARFVSSVTRVGEGRAGKDQPR